MRSDRRRGRGLLALCGRAGAPTLCQPDTSPRADNGAVGVDVDNRECSRWVGRCVGKQLVDKRVNVDGGSAQSNAHPDSRMLMDLLHLNVHALGCCRQLNKPLMSYTSWVLSLFLQALLTLVKKNSNWFNSAHVRPLPSSILTSWLMRGVRECLPTDCTLAVTPHLSANKWATPETFYLQHEGNTRSSTLGGTQFHAAVHVMNLRASWQKDTPVSCRCGWGRSGEDKHNKDNTFRMHSITPEDNLDNHT